MKMWLKLLLFVYLAIFALLGVSCSGNAGPNIIGTWQAEQGDPPLNNLITGIQFLKGDAFLFFNVINTSGITLFRILHTLSSKRVVAHWNTIILSHRVLSLSLMPMVMLPIFNT